MATDNKWNTTITMWMVSIFTGGEEGALKMFKQAMRLKNNTCASLFQKLKQLESPLIG